MRPPVLVLSLLLSACVADAGRGQGGLSQGWPQWQLIETDSLPAAWRVEEASFAFDAWEASATVTEVSTAAGVTTLGFDDGAGGVVGVRIPALPSAPSLARGDRVLVQLIHRQGFEGVAQGLVVFDEAGELLLLYDDGGYGPAFFDGSRAGIEVSRSLRGTGSGDAWESPDVTFRLGGESVMCAEGELTPLGDSGLFVAVVVSREWTGEPVTDADLSPLAYLVYRPR